MFKMFKVAKTKEGSKGKIAAIKAPGKIPALVDQFVELKNKASNIEAEIEIIKNEILNFAKPTYAKNMFAGKSGNFKIQGETCVATFMAVPNVNAGFTDEDKTALAEVFGAEIENLLVLDVKSIKFNEELFLQHRKAIEKALQKALPKDVVDNLFVAPTLKVVDDVLDKAADIAKDEDALESLYTALKIKQYIQKG